MTIPIINPSHYSNLKIQPVTYTMLNNFQFWRGNIIKYASRAGFKLYPGKSQIESEIIDLEKTMKCCKLVAKMELPAYSAVFNTYDV